MVQQGGNNALNRWLSVYDGRLSNRSVTIFTPNLNVAHYLKYVERARSTALTGR